MDRTMLLSLSISAFHPSTFSFHPIFFTFHPNSFFLGLDISLERLAQAWLGEQIPFSVFFFPFSYSFISVNSICIARCSWACDTAFSTTFKWK